MNTKPTLYEIDDKTGHVIRWLYRVSEFAESHPQYGTYEAVRKRVRKRHSNGLLESGAVVESNYGNLIDEQKYAAWALSPRSNGDGA